MLQGNKLQDEYLAKEQAKINRKKDLFEDRRKRILNAKVRLIGVDVDALNKQVLEKQRLKEMEKESDRFESKFECI